VGLAIILVLLPLSGVAGAIWVLLFYFPLMGGWIGGLSSPRLEIRNLPISASDAG
jgi:hypothetical protein